MTVLDRTSAYLRRVVDKPIADRRRSPREAQIISCYLFDEDGITTRATILDRSEGGVRLTCETETALERARYVLRLDTGAAYQLRLGWRLGTLASYEFRGRVDLSPRTSKQGVRAVQATWAEHIAAVQQS